MVLNAIFKLYAFQFPIINIKLPAIINNAAETVFIVSGSPKNKVANIIAMGTLNLSTGATCDTSPSCNALK